VQLMLGDWSYTANPRSASSRVVTYLVRTSASSRLQCDLRETCTKAGFATGRCIQASPQYASASIVH